MQASSPSTPFIPLPVPLLTRVSAESAPRGTSSHTTKQNAWHAAEPRARIVAIGSLSLSLSAQGQHTLYLRPPSCQPLPTKRHGPSSCCAAIKSWARVAFGIPSTLSTPPVTGHHRKKKLTPTDPPAQFLGSHDWNFLQKLHLLAQLPPRPGAGAAARE
jgi:hypothetical protein